MKKMHRFILTFAMALCSMAVLAQNGFNYQAVIRNNGEVISNQDVTLRISIMNGDAVCYQETQKTKTNAYGNITVSVGSGTATIGTFSAVPWATMQLTLKTEVDTDGSGNFVDMGQTPIQPVPFAQYAKKTSEIDNPSEIQIQAKANTGDDEALFAVKDEDGNVVFAVYKNGVRVYVDENDAKAAKSGFAVAGRSGKADEESQYFVVNKEGTKVYVDGENDKAAKATFAVASVRKGKTAEDNMLVISEEGTKVYVDGENDKAAKATFAVASVRKGKTAEDNILVISEEGTKVYVDGENDKAAKATFAVASVRKGKASEDNVLVINEEGTKVFIDDDANGKAAKATFAVASVKKSKDGQTANSNYLLIDSDSTRVYIDEANDGKAAKSGFAVAGKSGGKGTANNLFNIDLTKNAETLDSVNRIYWYPSKNAFMAGNLKVDSAAQVGTNSFNAGFQNTAKGEYSQALGYKSTAIGDYSTAIGREANAGADNAYAFGDSAQAQGEGSYAFGTGALATGKASIAFGSESWETFPGYSWRKYRAPAKAIGDYSYAIGSGAIAMYGSLAFGINANASSELSAAIGMETTASGHNSTAIGYGANAIGNSSFAIGFGVNAVGNNSTAMGSYTTANGETSTAMGYYTTAKSSYEVVVGKHNTDYTPNAGQSPGIPYWYENDRLFVVGNGKDDLTHSDALIIYKNGNAEFRGNIYPATTKYNWQSVMPTYTLGTNTNRWDTIYANVINATNGEIQSSDKRLKTNIKPLERALDKVITLNGVTYEWCVKEFPNKNFDSNRHVGVIAQEVEAVLPEAVETGADGYKSVNYSNITPLLIEAVKELKAEKDAQQAVIEAQNKKIEELEAQMREILEKLK